MNVGHFSISLAVKDLAASRRFYEAVGFEVVDGATEQNWVMLKNGEAKIGLFQGMFEDNLITLNPPDARAMQKAWQGAGFAVDNACQGEAGPASCMLRDPDGNLLLVDQH